jgi:hypothetical protein
MWQGNGLLVCRDPADTLVTKLAAAAVWDAIFHEKSQGILTEIAPS